MAVHQMCNGTQMLSSHKLPLKAVNQTICPLDNCTGSGVPIYTHVWLSFDIVTTLSLVLCQLYSWYTSIEYNIVTH